MIFWQTIVKLHLLILFFAPTYFTYPIYGTKRFGRTTNRRSNNLSLNGPQPLYQQPFARAQRYPTNYYDTYPYNRDDDDYYYYRRDGLQYPLYMPIPRTSKYEVYQAVLPYYYDDKLTSHPGYRYYGYNNNPEDSLEAEIAQESDIEEREESQPIGQEVLYENDDIDTNDSLEDANAMFMQNLMSPTFNNADPNLLPSQDLYGSRNYYVDDPVEEKWEPPIRNHQKLDQEDKDVRQLKQLVESNYFPKRPTAAEREYWLQRENSNTNKKQKISNKTNYNGQSKRDTTNANKKEIFDKQESPSNEKQQVPIKNILHKLTTTPPIKISIPVEQKETGQKEEVLMRPATPVRHSLPESFMHNMEDDLDHKREPSVYDTIKHMLEMENGLDVDNKVHLEDLHRPMRKRIVSSADSLTRQLSVLKKTM